MRRAGVSLVAVGSVLGVIVPAAAAPPQDLEAYCRASNPEPVAQVRCVGGEKASQERLARAQGAIDPQAWSRCQTGSASWVAMEACIAQPTPPAAQPTPPAATSAPTPPDATATAGSPSTTILGPQPGATPTAPEPERPSRPISEEEADKQVRDVLQRTGEPAAKCTKKQYGTGWVSVCE
jgi:hypothetical protein